MKMIKYLKDKLIEEEIGQLIKLSKMLIDEDYYFKDYKRTLRFYAEDNNMIYNSFLIKSKE